MSGHSFKTLGEICSNVSRRFIPPDNGKTWFINTSDVFCGEFLHSNISDWGGLPGQAKKSIVEGDILYSEIAPGNGRYLYVDKDYPTAVVSTKFMVLKCFDAILPRYLYHFITSPQIQNELKLIAESRSGTFPQITFDAIAHVPIYVPDKSEQMRIIEIPDAIERRVRTNTLKNQTLEEIAKAAFKSWFLNFDPVRAKVEGRPTGLPPEISDLFPDEFVESEIGEIPKGWKIQALDQIGTFKNGLALQKYPEQQGQERFPVVKIAQLRKGNTERGNLYASGVPQDFIIDDGDFIFSWSCSLLAKYWVGGKGALNQHLFKVESKDAPLWFVSQWVNHHMPDFQSIAESKTTTMGHIKREHLKQALCIVPNADLIENCQQIILPLIERLILTQQESRKLAELRDILLPKLISGELRIPDAEKFLEKVGM